jgi:iron only hydrogenase large subunit-like protein/nitrogen-specific signal transduction histidine kinase
VRECPAKAIRIANGQAEVIPARCIGCGNCVKVCSQRAKKVVPSIPEAEDILASGASVAAILAPSFPAEFLDLEYPQLVGMIRALGFNIVAEVGFGADLVARKMKQLLAKQNGNRYISTACPSVFGYVKRYHPELIQNLAPIVSPMVATARALRAIHGADLKIVFIGPCISKKIEAYSDEIKNEIDEVLTFGELWQMIKDNIPEIEKVPPSEFDPPFARKGALFPVGRGLLEASDIEEDLIAGQVISANGRTHFIDAIMEFSSGEAEASFLDVLCCDGCIMGSGMTTTEPYFKRRARIGQYVRKSLKIHSDEQWNDYMELFENLDLSRKFAAFDQRITPPDENTIKNILAKIGKFKPEDELNCGACGYDSCRDHAIAIHKGLAESEMCLPYAIEKLHETINELAVSNDELASTREALIQSEKMASMGQLSAGIAHEINNPLGVVLMYSHILLEEFNRESEIHEDLKMIAEHADRAKKIVAGLLNFARQNKVKLVPVNLGKIISAALKSNVIPPNIKVVIENELKDPVVDLDRDQIIQVLTNFINNSITAMPDGGELKFGLFGDEEKVYFSISDTGTGIPKDIISKVFDPFFTTKKAGKGTGLGLAIIYGIIKMHRGDVKVESNADPADGQTGTKFIITIPRQGVR